MILQFVAKIAQTMAAQVKNLGCGLRYECNLLVCPGAVSRSTGGESTDEETFCWPCRPDSGKRAGLFRQCRRPVRRGRRIQGLCAGRGWVRLLLRRQFGLWLGRERPACLRRAFRRYPAVPAHLAEYRRRDGLEACRAATTGRAIGSPLVLGVETTFKLRRSWGRVAAGAATRTVDETGAGNCTRPCGHAMDRALVYFTGGLAYGSVDNEAIDGPM